MSQTQIEAIKNGERIIVCDIKRSDTEVIRVTLGQYKKSVFVDQRIFFQDRETSGYRPTKKGLTLKSDQLSQLIDALNQAKVLLEQNK